MQIKIDNIIPGEENTNIESEVSEVFAAAILGNATRISNLIKMKTNRNRVNIYDSYQRTPIFWASTRGHTDVVDILVGEDALVNVGRSGNGANPLYQASKYGLFGTVSTLLQHPMIDINQVTFENNTSLMVASKYGHSKIVKKLLSVVNINVNHATFDGMTALFYAVWASQPTTLELLIRCPKTNTNLKDEEYMTALDRANEKNQSELIDLFRTRGYVQKLKGHTCCSRTINRGLHVAVKNVDLHWIKTFWYALELK